MANQSEQLCCEWLTATYIAKQNIIFLNLLFILIGLQWLSIGSIAQSSHTALSRHTHTHTHISGCFDFKQLLAYFINLQHESKSTRPKTACNLNLNSTCYILVEFNFGFGYGLTVYCFLPGLVKTKQQLLMVCNWLFFNRLSLQHINCGNDTYVLSSLMLDFR